MAELDSPVAHRLLRAVLTGVFLLVAPACSTLKVSTDYDRTVDFAAYRTYGWIDTQEIRNTLLKKRVMAAVDEELQGKGLVLKQDGSDLEVAIHPRFSSEVMVNTYSTGWGYSSGWGGWGGVGAGGTTSTVREVPVGTLIVDLVDTRRKELVWRGTATSPIDSEASAEERQEMVNDAIRKLFEDYPPKKN